VLELDPVEGVGAGAGRPGVTLHPVVELLRIDHALVLALVLVLGGLAVLALGLLLRVVLLLLGRWGR
jgi:hypothetical protein